LANHLALTVHGLPSEDSPSGVWLVDAGLGDGLHEPIPLHEGAYRQGPYRYRLRRSDIEPGGWRFDHDSKGSFTGMDFRAERATMDDLRERHVYLSTSPESGFVRTCVIQRRDATGVDELRGCVLRRVGKAADAPRTIETQAEWFEAIADVFGMPLTDVDAAARAALWTRVRTAHETWLESRAA
jgi:N-hydroxyarylamine O-acetyltransferase